MNGSGIYKIIESLSVICRQSRWVKSGGIMVPTYVLFLLAYLRGFLCAFSDRYEQERKREWHSWQNLQWTHTNAQSMTLTLNEVNAVS